MEHNLNELLRHYFEESHYELEPVPFGLTNYTRIVTLNDAKYVARIYNRQLKTVESMKFEAEVTSFLSKQKVTFVVPEFLNTYNSEPFVRLSDGTLGAMVTYVQGVVPEISTVEHAANYGYVVGEVSTALRHFQPQLGYEGIPFTELYRMHPLAGCEAVSSFFSEPPFIVAPNSVQFYKEKVAALEHSMSELLELPRGFVHHDLLIFNLLAKDNRIHGVLDLDFTSSDISFMEFAISLNHIIHLTNGSWDIVEAFIQGYSQVSGCTYREMKCLQRLTQLYHIAILHVYIGQHYAGKQIEPSFNYILNQFQVRDEWLSANHGAIVKLLEKYLIGS